MPYINDKNFDTLMPEDARDEFWRRVKFALRSYFRESETLADKFRESIEAASIFEQLLIYHRDPLGIAADLADARDTLPSYVDDFRQRFSDSLVP